MDQVKKFFQINQVVSTEELKSFIYNRFPDRDPDFFYFYVYDLAKSGLLYPLRSKTYKFSNRIPFEYEPSDKLTSIWNNIVSKFGSIEICIWETAFLSRFMNHQPFKNIIYIESELYGYEIVFREIAEFTLAEKPMVLLQPTHEIWRNYHSGDETIVVRRLLKKAPVKRAIRTSSIGRNQNYTPKPVFPAPKAEKILVDIFCDKVSRMFDKGGEMANIYRHILEKYQVNLVTLFSYAKNRSADDEIRTYLREEIGFDIETGDFF